MPVLRYCCECEDEFELPTAIDMGFVDPAEARHHDDSDRVTSADDPHDIISVNESMWCPDCEETMGCYFDDFLFVF